MSLRSLRALCLTSFFIADVRDGLGPFLGIFLTERHWTPDDIGILMTAGGLAGLLATLPAGFITDTSRNKRAVLALLCLLITLSTLLLWFSQQSGVVAVSQIITGICAAFVGPLITGITLGLTGQSGFSAQMGKNEAFNHAGNFMTALMAGGIAWYWGVGGIFLLMTCTTLLTLCALLAIRNKDIDNNAARGLSSPANLPVPGFAVLIKNRALFVTGLTLLLFHLANAALLPMLSMSLNQPRLVCSGHCHYFSGRDDPRRHLGRTENRTLRLLAINYAGAAGDAGACGAGGVHRRAVDDDPGANSRRAGRWHPRRRGTVVYCCAVARERARQCRAERGDVDAGRWGIDEPGVNRHDSRALLLCDGIQRAERDCAGGRPALVARCSPNLGNRQYAGWGIAATRRHTYASSLGQVSPFSSCCRLPSVVSEMLISASAVRNAW